MKHGGLAEMLEVGQAPGLCGSIGHKDPTAPDIAIPKALRELEKKHGASKIAKDAGWSVNTLKRVWNT